ncbi:MAG: DinB family protein [Anaerolineae bacterium]|nr:DinB family protein [Anaerolineae bacterium]
MNPHELEVLHMTTALRTQLLDSLTDADLAFKLPNNPTLGELCVGLGKVEHLYIDSFKTLRMPWEMVYTTEPGLENSVEKLKAWFKGLDDELVAALQAIPDGDFQSKMVDRGGGFMMPLGGQFHTYREAILIFCGKCTVYLLAAGKPLTQQWREWIG